MLKEIELFEEVDKVKLSIMRIKEFNEIANKMHPDGYQVCVSGGKDSTVITDLAIKSEVRCHFIHNLTSVDAPETIYYIRSEFRRLKEMGYKAEIEIPRDKNGKQITMWSGIVENGIPSGNMRWCCDKLKEPSGVGKFIILGIRREEGKRRNRRGVYEVGGKRRESRIYIMTDTEDKRRLIEKCNYRRKFISNPIIDWTENDVWEYIRQKKLSYNPLYDEGYKRVGCIGCPLAARRIDADFKRWPKYKDAYFRAIKKYVMKNTKEVVTEDEIMKQVNLLWSLWIHKYKDNELNYKLENLTD